MKAAPLKGDCILCQAPEPVRVSVNQAIWPEGVVRAVDYRAAAVRACKAAAALVGDDTAAFKNLNVKTVTRHADHIEASWREVDPSARLRDNEVPVAADFATVMETPARLGVKVMQGLEQLVDIDPLAFAALRTKEAIAIANLAVKAAGTQESSRLKRNQQAIDVMAIFGVSSGHIRAAVVEQDDDDLELDAMRLEVAEERRLLTANSG